MTNKILLTGSTGFIGTVLLSSLYNIRSVRVIGRTKPDPVSERDFICVSITSDSDYSKALTDITTVIHCAGRAHIMNDTVADPLESCREVNTFGTLNLAQQAADTGVKRFIFISSIKVNGESTELGLPFKPDDPFVPTDPYGLSKYEAEIGLRKIAIETGMEVVIIRPPLVYGPGVKANFNSMLKWIHKGLPLPLGGIVDNRRSMVSIDNLVDLIITCIDHPKAANQTFLVSDDHDLSLTALLSSIASALNVKNRLLPVPSSWLKFVAKILGKPSIATKLCGSLQVDISKTKELLDWKPPYLIEDGLSKTAEHFLIQLNK